jgi:hypothetical protein
VGYLFIRNVLQTTTMTDRIHMRDEHRMKASLLILNLKKATGSLKVRGNADKIYKIKAVKKHVVDILLEKHLNMIR